MIKLLFPNVVYDSVLSGGNWQPGDLSLDALRDPILSRVARSVDASNESTQFTIDLNEPSLIGGLVLLNHTLSLDATIRITLLLNNDTTRDPETFEVYPRIFSTQLLPFEAPNWFLGKPTRKDIALVTTTAILVFERDIQANKAFIEIFDDSNENGYIDIGKVFLGPSFRPSQNYSQGAQFSIVDSSKSYESLGGTRFFDKRSKRRSMSFGFSTLEERIYFAQHFDFMAKAGITEEIMLIPDESDVVNLQRKSICGTCRELNPLEQFSHDRLNISYVIEEQL